MGITISPASPPPFPPSTAAPADGDLANAASVNVAFQALMNGVDASRQILSTRAQSRLRSTDGTQLTVAPLGWRALTIGGVWQAVPATSLTSTFAVAAKLGGAPAATTRYYLYWGSVEADFVISTDVPDASLRWRGASTAYSYVGTFVTDNGGVVIPFEAADGHYRYTELIRALTIGASPPTTWTDLSLLPLVPAHSRLVCLSTLAFWAAANDITSFRTKAVTATGYGNAGYALNWSTGGVIANVQFQFDLVTDGAQVIQHKFGTGGAAAGLIVDVVGFSE